MAQSQPHRIDDIIGEAQQEEVFKYLDDLNESNAIKMFGARPYIQRAFPQYTRTQAAQLLLKWVDTFGTRNSGGDER